MNQLLARFLARVVCKKCKLSQSPKRYSCISGCGRRFRPRKVRNK